MRSWLRPLNSRGCPHSFLAPSALFAPLRSVPNKTSGCITHPPLHVIHPPLSVVTDHRPLLYVLVVSVVVVVLVVSPAGACAGAAVGVVTPGLVSTTVPRSTST